MSFLDDNGFQSLGWSPTLQFYFDELNEPSLVPARILSEDKTHFSVLLPNEVHGRAAISSSMRQLIDAGADKPAVGDWIACEPPKSSHDSYHVKVLLPRKSCVKRAKPCGGEQVILTNVDYIFITTSANSEFNLNRLDRYVSITLDSGAEPIVVLTKTDLMKNNELQQLKDHFPSVAVRGVTQKDPLSYTVLFQYLQKGSTVGLIGSSGVGKSTLINTLMGRKQQNVHEVREDDKGRHTTIKREFFVTPFGGWIADTPGIRELGMLDQQIGVASQFAQIVELAKNCRFRDCVHDKEPGCAILKALQAGTLPQEMWRNYQKIQDELAHYERRGNKAAIAEQKEKWKQIHKNQKALYKQRKNE